MDGVHDLYDSTDVFIIVDVLSFSTCVDIAVSNGASVLPYRFKDESAKEFAAFNDAVLAVHRTERGPFSLSPVSMFNTTPGLRIVLPSPNGSTLSLECKGKKVICGSLRNAQAVAIAAQSLGKTISVIPAGERWSNSNIRFALEDALGAGAILSYLQGDLSPEALSFVSLWKNSKDNVSQLLRDCYSGKELVMRDSEEDITLASIVNASNCVPILTEGMAFVAYGA